MATVGVKGLRPSNRTYGRVADLGRAVVVQDADELFVRDLARVCVVNDVKHVVQLTACRRKLCTT